MGTGKIPAGNRGRDPGAERIVVLLGPKHAGKTSAGRVLASLRGGVFIDLDVLVEEQTGSSPRELYRKGPDLFRKAEAAALAAALSAPAALADVPAATLVDVPAAVLAVTPPSDGRGGVSGRIIAAGGGIIDNPPAVDLLRASGAALVYLEVSAETAWERIRQSGGLPAFLLDAADPKTAHRELHLRRGARYRAIACITVAADRGSPGAVGGEIDRLLKDRRYFGGRAPAAQS
jgi:shikimate kinase